jgi:hypothetical protein
MPNTSHDSDANSLALKTLLPISPFSALQPHFGMLLGVEDLNVLQANPRGKQRLHNAWLHGEGIVWGFNVLMNERSELEVKPGLALDWAGHELYLERAACVDLGQWYELHRQDPEFDFEEGQNGSSVTFAVAVVVRFKACLSRPVPAISSDCDGSGTDTEFSRAQEQVELLLRPIPEPRPFRYPRLRVLFGHLEPPDPEAVDEAEKELAQELTDLRAARSSILADTPEAQLAELRRLAAKDVTELSPQARDGGRGLFLEDPTEVLLATVTSIQLKLLDDHWVLDDTAPAPEVDITVRPAHLATRTIQELLVPLCCASGQDGIELASGPKVTEVLLDAGAITLTLDRALESATVEASAFSVTRFDSDTGWTPVNVLDASVSTSSDLDVVVSLQDSLPADSLVRLIARGTGRTPLLGADSLLPLGYEGPADATAVDGHDFVYMHTFSAG